MAHLATVFTDVKQFPNNEVGHWTDLSYQMATSGEYRHKCPSIIRHHPGGF